MVVVVRESVRCGVRTLAGGEWYLPTISREVSGEEELGTSPCFKFQPLASNSKICTELLR